MGLRRAGVPNTSVVPKKVWKRSDHPAASTFLIDLREDQSRKWAPLDGGFVSPGTFPLILSSRFLKVARCIYIHIVAQFVYQPLVL